jgi:hypothetical protein
MSSLDRRPRAGTRRQKPADRLMTEMATTSDSLVTITRRGGE